MFLKAGDRVFAFYQLDQQFSDLLAHFQRRLYDGGKGGVEDVRRNGIGEPYQGYLPGNFYPHLAQQAKRGGAQPIAGGKDGIRSVLHFQ